MEELRTGPATADVVQQSLREVGCPGFDGNIVSLGFVKEIDVDGADLTISFAPDVRNESKVAQMMRDIRSAIDSLNAFDEVTIHQSQPFARQPKVGRPELTPLQAELMEDGLPVEPDQLNEALNRPDLAQGAGYTSNGPAPHEGPEFETQDPETYDGPVPVLQWEVDPRDRTAEGGEATIVIDEWETGVWWQVHPSGLVYVSMQAIRDDVQDHDGAARAHPVGRSEAVNLVYDKGRGAVVAIYGTVRDFRPFVDAFNRAFLSDRDET